MNNKTRSLFKAWVERLVRVSLPLELEKKILAGIPLTAEERGKFLAVFKLVCEEHHLREHKEFSAEHEEILTEIKRQGNLTRRKFDRLCETGEKPDKRPRAQRMWIDRSVSLYVKRHDMENDGAASFLSCCRRYWNQAQNNFQSLEQYKNYTAYDYRHFYDLVALVAQIKSGHIAF